jgi:hypothetical protein
MSTPRTRERPVGAGLSQEIQEIEDALIIADDASAIKRFAGMAAQAALVGHVLERRVSEHGAVTYRAAHWGWSRTFASMVDVEDWLRGVLGRTRSAIIDADNRRQDELAEVADLLRGTGVRG